MTPTSVRLWYPEPLVGTPLYRGFRFLEASNTSNNTLFQNVEHVFFRQAQTSDFAAADAVVLPNNFHKTLSATEERYIFQQVVRATTAGKKIFIFSCGDDTDAIGFDPSAWVFRYSVYRSTAHARDIVIPVTTEDPPPELIFERSKRPVPTVAFCGNGGFSSFRWAVGYVLKNLRYELAGWLQPARRARKLGVYWRRVMMRACERSPLVQTRFIVRNSFSGHRSTIEVDPAQARREYLETSAHADFVLTPKGDGNYSNRFFKTLAFGRIPVIVDTDIVLPLEASINYSEIMVRIPMTEVARTAELVRAWYDALTPDEWIARQKQARETYRTHLRVDEFFATFFADVFPTLEP